MTLRDHKDHIKAMIYSGDTTSVQLVNCESCSGTTLIKDILIKVFDKFNIQDIRIEI